jgi:hypothetical protein
MLDTSYLFNSQNLKLEQIFESKNEFGIFIIFTLLQVPNFVQVINKILYNCPI